MNSPLKPVFWIRIRILLLKPDQDPDPYHWFQVRDSVREVVATYSIDEGSMELVVSLPSNYPLGGLNVDSGKRVGVETGKQK